jgi:hypothetical protein
MKVTKEAEGEIDIMKRKLSIHQKLGLEQKVKHKQRVAYNWVSEQFPKVVNVITQQGCKR